MAGLIAWAVVAVVPITINTTGILLPGQHKAICWVDQDTAQKINAADAKATVANVNATSINILEPPMSSSEVIKSLGSDFYTDSIDLSDWNYAVELSFDDDVHVSDFAIKALVGDTQLAPVSIVVMEPHPINIALGKR